jgi:chemotaxis protein CheD
MPRKIEVTMGRGAVTRAPHIISSSGLGSCVVVTLYDTEQRLGGLAHIMLPDSNNLNGYHHPYKCADTAIATLIKELRSMRATHRDMVAKLVGGAKMFLASDDFGPGIGDQNIISIKRILERKRIPVIGENTGGNYGRNVEFYLDSGKVMVKAIGREVKEI